jgi:hypothetical protein
VHAGHVHTLHNPDKTVVSEDYFWREKDPREDRELFEPGSGWKTADRHRRLVTRRVAKLKYRGEMEQILVRYVDAMDRTDYDVEFLHMWALLEKITDTIGAKYDETIKGASWFLKEGLKGQQLLECIRKQRNRYVHSSQTVEYADQVAYASLSNIDGAACERFEFNQRGMANLE